MISPYWLAKLASASHECENCRAAREQLVGAYRRLDPNGMAKALTRATVHMMARRRITHISEDITPLAPSIAHHDDNVAWLEPAIRKNFARYAS